MTIPSEAVEQETLVAWFDKTFPAHRGRITASMNGAWIGGGKNKFSLISKYKRGGMRNGYPDLFLPVARKGYHGLFIEMKRLKGSITSKEQKDWHEYLNGQGYLCVVCRGAQSAIEIIDDYVKGDSCSK
ncbi:MAG: VRR-NUC domain-containing protein [Thiopseudomonas sp.]|nr:VRR-NUC domain-containing protein [Thiopseudomonas sp.]